ncbi:unnamed protein product [Cyprideis torosa]|uniref:Uncharacterized protein n=1 Tax=Cyprideis torosa TaxID=163714 RepID=A0A7R8W510_9CRUS|nr:unnamed protein product [Cyprideis torosa]CAG0883742.1 unnamed protein product [Cyprideis torosa]
MTPRISSHSDASGSMTVTEEETPKHNPFNFKTQIVWRNVILIGGAHLLFPVGVYLAITKAKWLTLALAVFLHFYSSMGITAGVHRLWAHRTYRAKWPLRFALMIANTIAFQNDIYEWSRDHRVHHKYTETDADPHNAKRGFFFSHVGWLLMRKHPEVIRKGKDIDMSDLMKDPIVMFQRRHYKPLMITLNLLLPSIIPWLCWGENLLVSYVINVSRWIFTVNATWLVNSAAHMWGDRPYDVTLNPAENTGVIILACGEGFHNYHHSFPRDYKTSEWGDYKFNVTTMFIDAMAKIGQAYDLKTMTQEQITARIARTGPNSPLGRRLMQEGGTGRVELSTEIEHPY